MRRILKGVKMGSVWLALFAYMIGPLALGSEIESYKYLDLTLERWASKGDPEIHLSEMSIFVGCHICSDPGKWSGASWRISQSSGKTCQQFDVNFLIEDRRGNQILSEIKKYNQRNAPLVKLNLSSHNIKEQDGIQSVRFGRRFDTQMYLTIKYWISNLKCSSTSQPKPKNDPDKIAIPLKDFLNGTNTNSE